MKRLIMIVVVAAIGWFLSRVLAAVGAGAARRTGVGGPPPSPGDEMVRDRVCNTFLPRRSALTSHRGGEEHFFCSERCRRSFLERAS